MTAAEQKLNQYLLDIDLKLLCLYYKRDEDGNFIEDENGNRVNDYYQATAGMMAIGEGWYPLIQELIAELIKTDWDRDIHQIKEKFGGLCFYIGSASEAVHKLVREYESKSYHICETCGEAGELRKDCGWGGSTWYKTMCDKHYLELKTERKDGYK